MLINPSFIEDESFTTEEKGVMLFIKANCEKGTNHFHFKSMAELKTKIGVGKNSTVIKDLESKGYVRIIGNAIIITCDAFSLYLNRNKKNDMYHIIYKYCIYKGVVPPLKEKWCLWYLYEKYANKIIELEEDLHNKCKNLPNDVSLHYFCKALLNKMPEKRPHYNYEFTM